jgi:hypothetical protein
MENSPFIWETHGAAPGRLRLGPEPGKRKTRGRNDRCVDTHRVLAFARRVRGDALVPRRLTYLDAARRIAPDATFGGN